MTGISQHELTLAFGILGNVVSFMVFLSPIPTFYKVHKRKSTEGFQSAPYVVGLFSAMLWIYYAFLKTNVILLITINSFGCFIETFYICFFLFYAPKKARMESVTLIVLLIGLGFGLIVGINQIFIKSVIHRVIIVGWICLIFSICVFIAPLGVVRRVIKTKSVEYMPILLSMALTLSAVMWFFYGLLLKDINIAIPNVLGFTFGILQMILYWVYKKKKVSDQKISEVTDEKSITIEVTDHDKSITFELTISDIEEQKMSQLTNQEIAEFVSLKTLMLFDIFPVVANLNKNGYDATRDGDVDPHAPSIVPNLTLEVAA